jgi:hypothetical protein
VITPTVGRILWFHPGSYDNISHDGVQPLAAVVTYVHSDTMLNLIVFDSNGGQHGRTSIRLVHDGLPPASVGESWCEWMPYQKGQAAKTEELEKKLGGST